MNITCSPINTSHEIIRRIVYISPAPFLLAGLFLPFLALIKNNGSLFFAALLCVATAIYMRHLGEKYWQFLRLDDEFEKLAQYDCGFASREDRAIDEVLMLAEKRYKLDLSEPGTLAQFHGLGTSRYGVEDDPWKN